MPAVPRTPIEVYWPRSAQAYRAPFVRTRDGYPELAHDAGTDEGRREQFDRPYPKGATTARNIARNLWGEFPGTMAPVRAFPPKPTAWAFTESLQEREQWRTPVSLTDAGRVSRSQRRDAGSLFRKQKADMIRDFYFGGTELGEAGQSISFFTPAAFLDSAPSNGRTSESMTSVTFPPEEPTASKSPDKPVWPWVVGGLGVLGLFGALWYAQRKRRNPRGRSRRRRRSRRRH